MILLGLLFFLVWSLCKIMAEKVKIVPWPTLNQCPNTGNVFGFLCPNGTGHSPEGSIIVLPTKGAVSLFPGCPTVPQPWHCSGKQIYHAIILQSDIPGYDKLALCNTLLLHWHELKPAGEQLGSHHPAMEQGNARLEQSLIWQIISLQWGDRT